MGEKGWPAGVALDSMRALDHLGEWPCVDCGEPHVLHPVHGTDGTFILDSWFSDHMYRPTPP